MKSLCALTLKCPFRNNHRESMVFYDEDVKNCPTFREVAKTLANFMEGCDLAGFNSNRFDIPLLAEEFLRAGVDIDMKKRKFIDVQAIFHKMEKRTLIAAYKLYCNKELEDAHSAMADTKATYEVLKAQLDCYQGQNMKTHLAANRLLL
jgi:DNA polymerase-3 subunit epsilon